MAVLLYLDLGGKLVEKPNPTAADISECMEVFCVRNKDEIATVDKAVAELRKDSILLRYLCDA